MADPYDRMTMQEFASKFRQVAAEKTRTIQVRARADIPLGEYPPQSGAPLSEVVKQHGTIDYGYRQITLRVVHPERSGFRERAGVCPL